MNLKHDANIMFYNILNKHTSKNVSKHIKKFAERQFQIKFTL
jgi:hypothetical protein